MGDRGEKVRTVTYCFWLCGRPGLGSVRDADGAVLRSRDSSVNAKFPKNNGWRRS